jgi:hypothetical protein
VGALLQGFCLERKSLLLSMMKNKTMIAEQSGGEPPAVRKMDE